MDKKDLVNVFDYEAAAREKLPKTAYDYYRSGANDEITLHDNHAAYERIQLKPKVLIDTSKRDLTTTVLGQTVSMPILVAPTAFHRMAPRLSTAWPIRRVKWQPPGRPDRPAPL
jgi:isopentenyl diphosphate isomerase/L-lactate dehydrogenase-like FMN-dependent dehydrogenase